jgi:exodeoxyribonuclease V alpha subunit
VSAPPPPAAEAPRETLEGTLERVVFQNPETQWTVARLQVTRGVRIQSVVTIVGALLGIKEGAELRLSGNWVVDKKFGEQFKVSSYQTIAPSTITGIEKYLGSGMVPGIGPELAKRIVAKFGMRTLEIISSDPSRLTEVEGIGRVRAQRIRGEWQSQREVQDVMVFLQGHGVSTAYAVRIFKKYGAAALGIVRENPYRLAIDVWGIGFKTADRVAQNLGLAKDSPARAEAGVLHVLGELVDDGHMHAPEHAVLAEAQKLLEIGEDVIRPAFDRLVAAGRLVREELGDRGDCLSLRAMHQAESECAAAVARLLATRAKPISVDMEKALAWFEKERQIALAPQQPEAIAAAVHDKLVVITGGPGVGKTTIVNAIIRILEKKARTILLAAPTGRAAKRLTETTERPARTIHRLLEWSPQASGFERTAENPLEADVIVVDEASMVDVPLFASLVAAVPDRAQLVLVGDVDQLPSFGPGRVLADVIASKRAKVVRLTEIFRQAASSQIVTNAHRVNRGEAPDLALATAENSDFYFIERDEPEATLATIVEVVAERVPRRFGLDAVNDVQVLAPMHRGDVGAMNLNLALQARLNPPRPGVAELARGQRTFRTGDKVIQLRNDYDKEVFNGDVGRIVAMELGGDSDEDRHITVEIDGREILYALSELDQLGHAYALSVHKSQGSEYPAVVVPLVTQHYMLLQRNLLYTAITRGKKLVVLVGSKKALNLAVRNNDTKLRWTWLAHRIQHAVAGARSPA